MVAPRPGSPLDQRPDRRSWHVLVGGDYSTIPNCLIEVAADSIEAWEQGACRDVHGPQPPHHHRLLCGWHPQLKERLLRRYRGLGQFSPKYIFDIRSDVQAHKELALLCDHSVKQSCSVVEVEDIRRSWLVVLMVVSRYPCSKPSGVSGRHCLVQGVQMDVFLRGCRRVDDSVR